MKHRCYLYVNNCVAFCFLIYSLCFVQMWAGKVTHILLWHITRGIAQAQSVQSVFPYCITNTNTQTALITAAGAGAASSLLPPPPWQMAQQQPSSTAPGPKEQMLDYRTLSGAFIFVEILDLTWLLLSSCHSERQQKPLKTRLCRPLAQPGATMSAGITTVWLIMAEIRVRVQSFRMRIFEDNYRGWKIGLRKILAGKIFYFLKMLPWKMFQGELVISYVETKNADSYLKGNNYKERSMLKSKDHFLSFFLPIGDCHFWSRFAIRFDWLWTKTNPRSRI